MTETRVPDTLAVVVVNYGSSALIEQNLLTRMAFLQSVNSLWTSVLTIVVDSFSAEAEQRRVSSLGSRYGVEVVLLDENLGFGASVNRGVDRAFSCGSTSVLVVNPDAWLDEQDVLELLSVVEAEPMTIAAPVTHRPDGTVLASEMDLYLDTGQLRSRRFRPADVDSDAVVSWVSGSCMLVSRDLWETLGGFDEEFFMYWEDVDLCYRALQVGGSVRIVSSARSVHDESGTQPTTNRRSHLFYYYNTRNRLLFARKNLAKERRRGWLRESVPNSYRTLRPEGMRLLTRPHQTLLAVVRGELAGRASLAGAMPQTTVDQSQMN